MLIAFFEYFPHKTSNIYQNKAKISKTGGLLEYCFFQNLFRTGGEQKSCRKKSKKSRGKSNEK